MKTSFGKSYHSALERHRFSYLLPLLEGKEVTIPSLVESYQRMESLLHKGANSKRLDVSTLKYCLDRLPEQIELVTKIHLVKDWQELSEKKIDVNSWTETRAKARRRRMFFKEETGELICFIASTSDVDDLANLLIAYQIEKTKLKRFLGRKLEAFFIKEAYRWLKISSDDWQRLKEALGEKWQQKLYLISGHQDFSLSLDFLNKKTDGSSKIAEKWWQEVSGQLLLFELGDVPIYFVSSNLHSLLNIIGGFVAQRHNQIFAHIEANYPELNQRWLEIKEGKDQLRINDLLYYFSKIYFQDFPDQLKKKKEEESLLGIKWSKPVKSSFCSDAQIVPVSAIANSIALDPHLKIKDRQKLKDSKALIFNINYPLGIAAQFLMEEVLKNFTKIKGVYIVGKAAILSGSVGDIQLPKVIFDEHTGNTYFVNNHLNENFPFESLGSRVLKDQKAISVYGTFLENKKQMEDYTSAGFNIIEMESGPYLTALAESQGEGEIRNRVLHLDQLPFDLGVINYASDNPLSKETLGAGSLALRGIESTYLALLAVTQRIIELEEKR